LQFDGTNWKCASPSSNPETDPTVPAWAKQSSPPPDRFGGMYISSNVPGACVSINPYTGGCSCPSGYSAKLLTGYTNYCYR